MSIVSDDSVKDSHLSSKLDEEIRNIDRNEMTQQKASMVLRSHIKVGE